MSGEESVVHARGRATTVIIDRHEIYRRGLRNLLEETGEFVVVGEGESVADARELCRTVSPDISAIDVELPDGDGLQLIRECLAADPTAQFVVVGEHACDRTKLAAVLVGAAGFVDKEDHADEVLAVVRAVADGLRIFTDDDVEQLLTNLGRDPQVESVITLDHLTPQESRVFELVGQGLTNREVAGHLELTEKTVKNYVSRVLTKLGMNRRTEIAVLATRLAAHQDHEHAAV